jgi:DNA-binding transcriptional ArsR family regulator
MTERYISVNMDDEKITQIAEILSNKTCKKILDYLAEKDASEGDISRDLKLAISTVEYNLNKLIDAGLVRAGKNFFWSVKGKKIKIYGLANKKIIISTKRSFGGMIVSILAGGVILGAVKLFMNYNNVKSFGGAQVMDNAAEKFAYSPASASEIATRSFESLSYFNGILVWIIVGLVIGALGFFLFKKLKGGVK